MSRLRRIASYIYKESLWRNATGSLYVCRAAGVTSSTPPKLSMASLYVRMSSALLIHVCAPSSGSNGLLLSMVASCAALRAAARLVLTFSPEAYILFAEGFGANTSERLAAEKEAALITFFFAHPAGRTSTICHLRRFGSEACRHRLCSGLWLFLRSGPERRIWNNCTGHHLLRCMSMPLASTSRGRCAYSAPLRISCVLTFPVPCGTVVSTVDAPSLKTMLRSSSAPVGDGASTLFIAVISSGSRK